MTELSDRSVVSFTTEEGEGTGREEGGGKVRLGGKVAEEGGMDSIGWEQFFHWIGVKNHFSHCEHRSNWVSAESSCSVCMNVIDQDQERDAVGEVEEKDGTTTNGTTTNGAATSDATNGATTSGVRAGTTVVEAAAVEAGLESAEADRNGVGNGGGGGGGDGGGDGGDDSRDGIVSDDRDDSDGRDGIDGSDDSGGSDPYEYDSDGTGCHTHHVDHVDEAAVAIDSCGHVFHYGCIIRWITRKVNRLKSEPTL